MDIEKGKGSAAIERLRASKARVADADEALGCEAGLRWAAEHAEHGELRRVAEFYGTSQPGSMNDDAGFWLYGALAQEERPDHREVAEFWERWAGIANPSEEFVLGFAQGASEFLDDVNDEL